MEKIQAKAIIVALALVMGTLVEKSEAQIPQFGVCFGICIVGCVIHPHDFKACSLNCLKRCVFGGAGSRYDKVAQPCVLDCAQSSCANISTVDKPAVEEVEKCVGSCEQSCVKV